MNAAMIAPQSGGMSSGLPFSAWLASFLAPITFVLLVSVPLGFGLSGFDPEAKSAGFLVVMTAMVWLIHGQLCAKVEYDPGTWQYYVMNQGGIAFYTMLGRLILIVVAIAFFGLLVIGYGKIFSVDIVGWVANEVYHPFIS